MTRSVAERFWSKVVKLPGRNACWEWTAAKVGGYGVIRVDGANAMTHRWSWGEKNGPIPAGQRVLHKCDNPPCVRPGHLFLGTLAENNRDMSRKRRHANQRKTHCNRGHAYTDGNTYVDPHGSRHCRMCQLVRREAYQEKIAEGHEPNRKRGHRCSRGHWRTKKNTYVDPTTGVRICRMCQNEAARARHTHAPPKDPDHCKHGHTRAEFGKLNSNGDWVCAECRRLSAERYNRKKAAERLPS